MGGLEFAAPQLIWLGFAAAGLGIAAARHGQPREERTSFWVSLTATLITSGLLYWGGFFSA